jgi:predicted metal-dependent peptidase
MEITADELCGVLLHEVHHVVFGHVLADPADYPDEWARTMAEEITVNEFITEPLPGEPIRLEQFPGLPTMESTRQRYEKLKQMKNRPAIALLSQSLAASQQGTGNDSPTQRHVDDRKQDQPMAGTVLDDHSVWQAGRDRDRSTEVLHALLEDVVAEVGLDTVPTHLRDVLQGICAGSTLGGGECELESCGRGQLDWVRLLRRYAGRHLVLQPDFARPSRRFPDLVGIVPGRRRRGGRPHVMAVIDTSASLTSELLDLINAELARLAGEHQVTVVECDEEIQRVYPYRRVQSVLGRGGTDLQPPFEPLFLRRHRPDLVIYFTDGYGPAPDTAPRVPVLWCLTPSGVEPAGWGTTLRMCELGARNSR